MNISQKIFLNVYDNCRKQVKDFPQKKDINTDEPQVNDLINILKFVTRIKNSKWCIIQLLKQQELEIEKFDGDINKYKLIIEMAR